MTDTLEQSDLVVAATYDAAVDHFDLPALGFWDRHGRKAIELVHLRRGDLVLDVGCGTGASALPAARAVAPTGHVTGLDLSEGMLGLARAKAFAARLTNVEFHLRDMRRSKLADQSFDAVISVFSLFFVSNMEAQVAELWRLLKPGGRLVVTVWAEGAFDPVRSVFASELERHGLSISQRPWERVTTPDALSRLLTSGGAAAPTLHAVPDRQSLTNSGDGWSIAMGTGLRWEVERLSPDAREDLRERLTAWLRVNETKHIETSVIHAVSVKGG